MPPTEHRDPMSATIIPLRRTDPEAHRLLASLPPLDEPLSVTLPAHLAKAVRIAASMQLKSPEQFVIDGLRFGLGEPAA